MQLSTQPTFQFWIRRSDDIEAPYSLRFKVHGGKGLLRVAHPDMLLDPPAAEEGLQECLSAAVVRASRFLLVAEGGRMRKGFFLAALGDRLLDRLPMDTWVDLTPRVAGDMRLLIPLGRLPEGAPPEDQDEDNLPEGDDLVTQPGEGSSERYRVREVLRTFGPAADDTAEDADGPVLRERTWGDDDQREHAIDATDPSIGSDPIFIGGTEDEARALVGATLLASASMFDPPAPPPSSSPTSPPPVGETAPPAASSLAPPTEGARPQIELDEIPFGPTRSALVRHLRRSSRRDQDQIESLKARITELERQLLEARGGAASDRGEGA